MGFPTEFVLSQQTIESKIFMPHKGSNKEKSRDRPSCIDAPRIRLSPETNKSIVVTA